MTCNRVAIINQGQIVATDTPDNLMSRLTGKTGYEVEIQGDPQVALQRLQTVSGIREINLVDREGLPQQHHRLQVLSDGNRDPGGEIAAALVAAGLGLYELRRTRISLEDVFLNLTTQEKTALDLIESTSMSSDANFAQDSLTDDTVKEPEEAEST